MVACGDGGTGGSGGSAAGGGGAGGGGVERTYDAGGQVAEMVANATHLFTASGFEVRRIDLATGDSVVLTTVEDGHPSKIAIEGQDLIWMETIGSEEGAVIRKIPVDAAPGTPSTLVVEDGYSTTFAVSETTIYYPLAFAIRSVPIAGGPATDLYTGDDGPGTGFHMGAFDFNRATRELVYYEGTGIFTLSEAGGAPQVRLPGFHPDGLTYGRLEVTSPQSVAWMECEDPNEPLRFRKGDLPGGGFTLVTSVPQTNPFIQCPWMTTSSDSGLTAYFVVNQDDGMGGDEWKAYVGADAGAPAREFGPADAFTLGPITKNDQYVFLAAEVGVDSLIYAYPRPL